MKLRFRQVGASDGTLQPGDVIETSCMKFQLICIDICLLICQEIYINIYQLPTKKTKVKTFRSQRLQGAKCRYTLRPTAGVATRVAALRDQVWKWPSATKFDRIWINPKQIRFRVPRKPTDSVRPF